MPLDSASTRNSNETQESLTSAQIDAMIAEYDQNSELEALYNFVMRHANDAKAFRQSSGVDDLMYQATQAVNNCYESCDLALIDEATSDVYMGITNLKVRAFRSWVADILINAEDKPWTIKPTPVPDLPSDIEETIIDRLMDELRAGGFEGTVVDRLTNLKRIAKTHMDDITKEASLAMEDIIEDQLLEGGWRESFDQFIDDLGTMPAAVLKGPVVEYAARPKWNGMKVETVMKPMYRVRRVDPRDFFPSADSTNTQDGSYLVERMRMTSEALIGASKISGFSEDAVRAVLAEFKSGWSWSGTASAATAPAATAEQEENGTPAALINSASSAETGGLYHVLVYYGRISGAMLLEWGVTGVDPQGAVESEVWVCGNKVIRAVINSYPGMKRPFYTTSFDKKVGSIWGRGLPALLRHIQRLANASVRALVKNMAYSAGPIGEVDVGRLASEDDVTEVSPYRIYAVDADPITQHTMPAFRFFKVESNAAELLGIYEKFVKEADDVSGIPSYVLGNPQVAGAGRTLGGLSLLMGNAAKGIKKVISQIDKDVIEPLISTYHFMNLMFYPDDTVKFDSSVVARGSSGLLQRELQQARAVDVLNTLVPFRQSGDVPAQGLQIVLRDVIRGLGYSADDVIPDPRRQKVLSQYLDSGVVQSGTITPPPSGGQGGSGQALPAAALPAAPNPDGAAPLDGRSAAAVASNAVSGPIPSGP